ncbi:hypothetical protein [Sediminicola luteus]|uniref:DUF1508 domain-containing protein n=1 Tax=Sediminicola luteus TaxID=319238 RepID=A0ABV2TWX2_9FLAO
MAISPMEHTKNRLLHCVRNDGGEDCFTAFAMTVAKGHCERTAGERGNLTNGTQEGQIATAKTPRNDGSEKQIASAKTPRNDGREKVGSFLEQV